MALRGEERTIPFANRVALSASSVMAWRGIAKRLTLMLLRELREEVCQLHAELPRNDLVAWTSGNISARDPSTNLVVIKPSGVRFEDLTPASMVVTDLAGARGRRRFGAIL